MAVEIRIGDALDQLREMPDESVHCCVTSPPYWGLRDYGVDGQIGLEETPDEWCARLVEVFREVKRVLRNDGTCWVNVGDSYAGSWGAQGKRYVEAEISRNSVLNHPKRAKNTGSIKQDGLKPKDLIGQPWLLAFALRADGWFLRDAIVWAKPNPMPESVKDRCTNAYEHVFLLAKSKRYFFDAEAIKETATNGTDLGLLRGRSFADGERVNWHAPSIQKRQANGVDSRTAGDGYRNSRNVWTIATEPFAEAHFATFPTELARRCILAGTSSKGVCAACGAPWARSIQASGGILGQAWADHSADQKMGNKALRPGKLRSQWDTYKRETLGWHPSCQCDAEIAQATVLDPFGGAGTTALVADRLQRNAVLIELNADYAAMAQRRMDGDRGDLLDIIEQPKAVQETMRFYGTGVGP